MSATLTIRDSIMGPGADDHVFELEFPSESITVRELIRERVYQQVDDHNRSIRISEEPKPARRTLFRIFELRPAEDATATCEVDWKEQFRLATEAYECRRVLVLVDDRQTESLDERIEIERGTEVTFLRLVPLTGG